MTYIDRPYKEKGIRKKEQGIREKEQGKRYKEKGKKELTLCSSYIDASKYTFKKMHFLLLHPYQMFIGGQFY